MARVAGVSRANLSQIEAGVRVPSDDEVEKIVETYGAELEALYEWRAPQFLAVQLDPKDEG